MDFDGRQEIQKSIASDMKPVDMKGLKDVASMTTFTAARIGAQDPLNDENRIWVDKGEELPIPPRGTFFVWTDEGWVRFFTPKGTVIKGPAVIASFSIHHHDEGIFAKQHDAATTRAKKIRVATIAGISAGLLGLMGLAVGEVSPQNETMILMMAGFCALVIITSQSPRATDITPLEKELRERVEMQFLTPGPVVNGRVVA